MDKGQKFITANLIHLQICRFQNGLFVILQMYRCSELQSCRLPNCKFAVLNLRLWIHHGDPYLLSSPYLVTISVPHVRYKASKASAQLAHKFTVHKSTDDACWVQAENWPLLGQTLKLFFPRISKLLANSIFALYGIWSVLQICRFSKR